MCFPCPDTGRVSTDPLKSTLLSSSALGPYRRTQEPPQPYQCSWTVCELSVDNRDLFAVTDTTPDPTSLFRMCLGRDPSTTRVTRYSVVLKGRRV